MTQRRYKLTLFLYNEYLVMADPKVFYINISSEMPTLIKTKIHFLDPFSDYDLSAMCCILAQSIKLPANTYHPHYHHFISHACRVFNRNGVGCDVDYMINQAHIVTVQRTDSNTTYYDREIPYNPFQVTNASISIAGSAIPSPKTTSFYYIINEDIDDELLFDIEDFWNIDLVTEENLKTVLLSNVSWSFPRIVTHSFIGNVTLQIPKLIGDPVVTVGSDWIDISSIQTDENAFIWLSMDNNINGVPTIEQLKATTNHFGNPVLISFQFQTEKNIGASFNFSNLANSTTYQFYMGVLKEDPSPYLDYEPKVYEIQASTLADNVIIVELTALARTAGTFLIWVSLCLLKVGI